MGKEKILKGNVWLINDQNNNYVDSIDTDMIFHNAHLAITEVSKMGQYTFGNLDGWKDFSQKAKPNDIVFVGANFGAGSSRQQAVDCFRALGVSCIVAESFGAIYKRNAINSGLPILTCPDIKKLPVKTGQEISINLETGEIIDSSSKTIGKCLPFSTVQMDIYNAGDIFSFGKNI